jgi:hypothetical protein
VSADGKAGAAHMPAGPDWGCNDCAPRAAWPCPDARAGLLKEFADDRIGLHLYLASAFVRACEDMPGVQAGLLLGRFIGWAR